MIHILRVTYYMRLSSTLPIEYLTCFFIDFLEDAVDNWVAPTWHSRGAMYESSTLKLSNRGLRVQGFYLAQPRSHI